MTLIEFFRKLGRNLMPPGNRGSYDSEWEQPNRPPGLDVSSGPPAGDPGQTGV